MLKNSFKRASIVPSWCTCSYEQFPRPVPLEDIVGGLLDLWEQEEYMD
jgi:hypothetical protein